MSTKQRFLAALVALAVPVGGVARGDEPADAPRRGDVPRPFAARLPEGFAPNPFWIGAMCAPVDPALRAQLNLDDRQGLLITNLVPDSPAAKAGLKKYDVVASIDGRPVGELHELMEAVRMAADQELKFEVLRGGKRETVAVTPAKRPDADALLFTAPLGPDGPAADPARMREQIDRLQQHIEQLRERMPEAELKRMEQWLEQLRRGENQPFRMQMFGPGVVMRKFGAPALPPGVDVRIERNGDEPAKIHVERGGEKWDVTDQEIDKLPEDLRGPIGAMLVPGVGAAVGRDGAAAAAIASGTGGAGKVEVEIHTDGADQRKIVVGPQSGDDMPRKMAEELRRLRAQVEDLQKKVDDLNKQRKALPTPKKEPAVEEQTRAR